MHIELAPQDKLKFLKKIEYIFVEKIIEENCLITDESSLLDFICMFDVSYSLRPSDNGKYFFQIRLAKDLNGEFEDKIIEAEASNHKAELLNKIKTVFGVDVSYQYKNKLPELFHYIYINMPELNKKRLQFI
jgi:hypothetical protein